MSKYSRKDGEKSCYNCGETPAPKYGGSFFQNAKKIDIHRCVECHEGYRNRNKPKEATPMEKKVEETPKELPQPSRLDTFMGGHDNARYYQASLFDE